MVVTDGVAHVNKVTLRCAGLVHRWVTIRQYTILVFNQPFRPTQPGHPSMGRRNEYCMVMVTAIAGEETVSSA